MIRKLYGNIITTSKSQQEILTPENIGLEKAKPNTVCSVKDFQILNEGTNTIRVQINEGSIIPLSSGTGLEMGDDWTYSCIVHTQGAKVMWVCKR